MVGRIRRLKFPLIPLLRIEATGKVSWGMFLNLKFPLIPLLRIEATVIKGLGVTLRQAKMFPLIPLLRIEATPLF